MIRHRNLVMAFLSFIFFLLILPGAVVLSADENVTEEPYQIALGDTWEALARRSNMAAEDLVRNNLTINPQRQPAVGSIINLPHSRQRNGRLLRPFAGGTLAIAAQNGRNPWALSLQNDLDHPYQPLLYAPFLLPGGSASVRELPPGLEQLSLAPGEITPGSAFALRGSPPDPALQVTLEAQPLAVSSTDNQTVAMGATGAFFPPGQPLLAIRSGENPLWEQPLIIADREWTWEEVTFTNSAVLDPETLQQERERLQAIWDEVTPQAMWQGEFQTPITDFVEISSYYGARRSVNGGPFSTYHEGTDYSAYGGTPVRAPAAGKVVLAELLAIRGGAVILDHGLGIHSGYYHLSAVHVHPGQLVEPGDLLGEVGTTGRSTGNHLHWDLLIGRTWIDGYAWLEQGIDEWLSPSPIEDHRLPEQ
ncbi:MAG: M23 family metallopeptidase [Candidatus Promineifilaceae bacterium]